GSPRSECRRREMIHVAQTVSRRAEIKQAHFWCVFIDSKSFGRLVGRMCTTSCDQNRSEQRGQSLNHPPKNRIHSKLLSKEKYISRTAFTLTYLFENTSSITPRQREIRRNKKFCFAIT